MRHALFALVLAGCGTDEDPNCIEPRSAPLGHQHEDGEGSHAGRSCLEGGCHLAGDLGPGAPAYHAAGTVYKKDLVTPAPGVTVRFSPLTAGATAVEAVTDTDGNFFVLSTEPNPFPSIPEVNACPDVHKMIEGALDPSYGSCAAASCHSPGAGRGVIFIGD